MKHMYTPKGQEIIEAAVSVVGKETGVAHCKMLDGSIRKILSTQRIQDRFSGRTIPVELLLTPLS